MILLMMILDIIFGLAGLTHHVMKKLARKYQKEQKNDIKTLLKILCMAKGIR